MDFLFSSVQLHYAINLQYLKTLLKQVERGLTREEIKKDIEHNPYKITKEMVACSMGKLEKMK